MTTLAIETSTPCGSVAVLEDGISVFNEVFTADRSHASSLFQSLERARKRLDRCDTIAVGLGPGSYAGIRVAISAAIGISTGFSSKLVGIPSVVAMASRSGEYIVLGDARRGSFYYAFVHNGECIEGPELLTEDQMQSRIMHRPDRLIVASEPLDFVPRAERAFPSALRLARLAEAGKSIMMYGDLEPVYLREPQITEPKPMRPLRST
jgi:tRNA threonylcarbamoyladenosine biosynthesis protein TsaB